MPLGDVLGSLSLSPSLGTGFEWFAGTPQPAKPRLPNTSRTRPNPDT